MNRKKAQDRTASVIDVTLFHCGIDRHSELFHVDVRGMKHLHEWMSVFFLILCVVHLILNWKAFRAHLKNGPVLVSVMVICLLLALLLFSAGEKGKNAPYDRSGPGNYKHQNYKH